MIRGLTIADTHILTIGMWMDFIIEYDEMHRRWNEKDKEEKEGGPKARTATQADFDAF